MKDQEDTVSVALPDGRDAKSRLDGERHTAFLRVLTIGLQAQHPGAFHEDGDGELVIPSGVTPQTAYVKIDVSELAERLLLAGDRAPAAGWRCFQCDEHFTDARAAAEHFTHSPLTAPACVRQLTFTERRVQAQIAYAEANAHRLYLIKSELERSLSEAAGPDAVRHAYDRANATLAAQPAGALVPTERFAAMEQACEVCGTRWTAHEVLPCPTCGSAPPPSPPYDVWAGIGSDERLKRARQRLSMHELRLIVGHAQGTPLPEPPRDQQVEDESSRETIDPLPSLPDGPHVAGGEP